VGQVSLEKELEQQQPSAQAVSLQLGAWASPRLEYIIDVYKRNKQEYKISCVIYLRNHTCRRFVDLRLSLGLHGWKGNHLLCGRLLCRWNTCFHNRRGHTLSCSDQAQTLRESYLQVVRLGPHETSLRFHLLLLKWLEEVSLSDTD
jgi:hypothetical protein